MRTWRWSGASFVALSIGMTCVILWPAKTPAIASFQVAPVAAVRENLRGAGSCSAQACHGGTSRLPATLSPIWRSEHTVWVTRDEHADAYQVLLNERSASIAAKLALPSGKPATPASEDVRCLACHSIPSTDILGVDATIRADGVSCEACHGPSGGWLAEHTTYGWRDSPSDYKRSRGMTVMGSLADRVELCAGCHVGAAADPARGTPLRDVNHDLIAAGHPRLNFEFAAFQANQPRHWDEKGANAAPDFPARSWLIGQAATMKSALELLADRAAQASKHAAPWPEFTEYGCYSCHFQLQPKTWRNRSLAERDPEQPLGTPAWNTWNAPIVLELAAKFGGPESAAAASAIKDVKIAMGSPSPDTAQVQARCAAGIARLNDWLRAISDPKPIEPATLHEWMTGLEPPSARSWDHAAQRYLALSAFDRALTKQGQPSPRLKANLDDWLKNHLEFTPGFDSRVDFKPGQ